MGKPLLIEIEGSDGSGKETQSKLLLEMMENNGYKTKIISFPMYDNISSTFVKEYLNGAYGMDTMSINPYISSMFFTNDRLASYLTDWKRLVEDENLDFIIFDRYTGSNLIHQTVKFEKVHERIEFIKFQQDYEYSKLKLPRPDIVLYLNMPRWAAKKLTMGRLNKSNGESKQDIHESNEEYMVNVYTTSNIICKYLRWTQIKCTDDDNKYILQPELITRKLYTHCMNLINLNKEREK